jgi:pimeloyl-ACP methyl ester carboxylesterase
MKDIFKKITSEDLTQVATHIKPFTLIIWGQDDKILPVEDAFVIKELIRNSDVEIISGAKHGPQFTHPVTLAKIILNFISSNGN